MNFLRLSVVLAMMSCAGVLSGAANEEHGDHDEHGEEGGHGEEGDHGEEGHDEHAETVELSPKALEAARLVVEIATEKALAPSLTTPARIVLDPRREAIVSAWIGGQVGTIQVRAGDKVKKGQILGSVQSPELGVAIGAYRSALARNRAADARLARLRRLLADGVAARAQVLEAEALSAEASGALEASEERLRVLGVNPETGDPRHGEHYPSHIPIKTPIAGRVLVASLTAGSRVEPGEPLFRIGDLSEVWLIVDLNERDLASVSVGQTVRFTVSAWKDRIFEGQIQYVGDWVDPVSRTVEVRVQVPNEDSSLKPNMFASASVSMTSAEAPVGVVVPSHAVQLVEGHESVFVRRKDGVFEVRNVDISQRTSDRVLVTEGLSVGDAVVVQGAFTLKSELEKAELGGGHAH